MPDEITNSELARRIDFSNADIARRIDDVNQRMDHLSSDIRDDMAEIKADLKLKVGRDVYDAQQVELRRRIEALEARARWVVATVIVPLVIVIVQWLLSARGVKP